MLVSAEALLAGFRPLCDHIADGHEPQLVTYVSLGKVREDTPLGYATAADDAYPDRQV
jgi:hypothetical protein